jgi:uncharacterized DUF497 family protein
MNIEFDPAKRERNVALGRLPFEAAHDFEWSTALYGLSKVQTEAATRFLAVGALGETVQVIVYTVIDGGIRIISLGPANRKERAKWQDSQ